MIPPVYLVLFIGFFIALAHLSAHVLSRFFKQGVVRAAALLPIYTGFFIAGAYLLIVILSLFTENVDAGVMLMMGGLVAYPLGLLYIIVFLHYRDRRRNA